VDEELRATISQKMTKAAEESLRRTARDFLVRGRTGYDQVVWLAKLTSWDTGYEMLSLYKRIRSGITNHRRSLVGSGAVLAVIVLGLVICQVTRKESSQ
jgi:hypothetical protein